MKRRFLFLFCLTIAFLLVGCSKSAVGEAALKNDLYNSDSFSIFANDMGMKIKDLDVVKRQTSPKDKIDKVWVRVQASSDAVEGELYYLMTYNLYNDGWLLETVADDNPKAWYFTPLCGVSDEEIATYLPENAEIVNSDVDYAEGVQQIIYKYTEHFRYCDVYHTNKLSFHFGNTHYSMLPGRWSSGYIVDLETYEEWDIDGTWRYSEASEAAVSETIVTINGFAPYDIAYIKSPSSFAVDGYCSHYFSSKYFFGGIDECDEDGFSSKIKESADGIVFYELYTDITSSIYFGNAVYVRVERDGLFLGRGEAAELTRGYSWSNALNPRLVDDAELLNSAEREILLHKLNHFSETFRFDFVIVTTNTLDGKSPESYAEDYYRDNHFGYGERNDGILLLISTEDRDYDICARGLGSDIIYDYGFDEISASILPNLSAGNHYSAFNTFIDTTKSIIKTEFELKKISRWR